MEPTDPWVLIAVALATATVASSVGLGGGLLIVPYLVGVAGFHHRVADATSLVVVGVSALAACAGYVRQKRVDLSAAGVFAVAMMPGAALGAWGASRVDEKLFVGLLGGLLAAAALSILVLPRAEGERRRAAGGGCCVLQRSYRSLEGQDVPYGVDLRIGIPAALVAGTLGGFFGVGGGIVMVPVMYLVLGMPFRIAAPTSSAMMVPMSMVAIGTHWSGGAAPDPSAAWLAAGALGGGALAAVLTARVPGYVLRRLMALLLLAVAALQVREVLR